jgi:hypothetical protein
LIMLHPNCHKQLHSGAITGFQEIGAFHKA